MHDQPHPRPFAVNATIERGPRLNDPLGHILDIGFRFEGCLTAKVDVHKAVRVEDAFSKGPASAEAGALIKGTSEVADKVFNAIFETVHKEFYGRDPVAGKYEHPRVALRREVEALKAKLADVCQQLHDAELQRNELRMIFAHPIDMQKVELT